MFVIEYPIVFPVYLIMFIRDRSQPQYEGTACFRQLQNWQGETVCSEAHLDLFSELILGFLYSERMVKCFC